MSNIFTKLKLIFTSIWILISCIFLFILIFIPCILYRLILEKFLKNCFRPDLSHLLCTHGAVFINHSLEESNCNNIIVKLTLDGELDLKRFKSLISDKVINAQRKGGGGFHNNATTLLYPEFRQYFVKWGGYWWWKNEEEFNLDSHIKMLDHRVVIQEVGSDELLQFGLDYAKIPFESSKSPWEICLVNNMTGNDGRHCWILFFKFHHSFADGYSLFHALMQCSDHPPASIFVSKQVAPSARQIVSNFFQAIGFPFLAAYEIAKQRRTYSNMQPPWDAVGGYVSKDVSLDAVSQANARLITISNILQVSAIKRCAVKTRTSFTAVLLAGLSGGIRKYLTQRHQTSNEPQEIPEYIHGIIPGPVLGRPDGLINALCHIHLQLPVGVPYDPLLRLKLCHSTMIEGSSEIARRTSYFICTSVGMIPRLFSLLPIVQEFPPISISNFPGPLKSISFDGQVVMNMNYTMVSNPCGLFLSILTYADKLQFYASCDPKIFGSVENVKKLVQGIEEEFTRLLGEEVVDMVEVG